MDFPLFFNAKFVFRRNETELNPFLKLKKCSIYIYINYTIGIAIFKEVYVVKKFLKTLSLSFFLLISSSIVSTSYVYAEATKEVPINVQWIDDSGASLNPKDFTVSVETEKVRFGRYAVQVYGIGIDDLSDDNGSSTYKAGLTIGPALGDNFTGSQLYGFSSYGYGFLNFKDHIPTGQTSGEMSKDGQAHNHRCFHHDMWDEILYWNNLDPQVYEQCIQAQCTNHIEMYDKGELLFNDRHPLTISYEGDGAGALLHEMQPSAKRFQGGAGGGEIIDEFSGSKIVCENNGGYWYDARCHTEPDIPVVGDYGWTHSNARAILNGKTNDSLETNFANKYGIDENKSVLGSFPENIKNMIGTRQVQTYNNGTLNTTYDKLWLLSVEEIYGPGTVRDEQGNFSVLQESTLSRAYPRFTGLVNKNNARNQALSSYSYSNQESYSSKVTDCYSLRTADYDQVRKINGSGSLGRTSHTTTCALAPAFALKREAPQENTGSPVTTITKDVVLNESTPYNFVIPVDEKIVAINSDKVSRFTKVTDLEKRSIVLTIENFSAQGGQAKVEKYLIMDADAEVPEVDFTFTISAGEGIPPTSNTAWVLPGKEPEKVKINGTAGTGVLHFSAGEATSLGPLNNMADNNQKFTVKDIILDFSDVKFSEAGVYRYILKENATNNPAITNDQEQFRVIDVHVNWNDEGTELIIGGYVGYLGITRNAPKLLPEFNYEYIDTDQDGTISQEEKDAQADDYSAAYSDFIASIQDGSGKPDGSYVNAETPIEVEAGDKSNQYVNRINSANISLTKEVRGNQGSKDQYFEFEISINNAGNGSVFTLDMTDADISTIKNNATSFTKEVMDAANGRDDDKGESRYTLKISKNLYNRLSPQEKESLYIIEEDVSYTIPSGDPTISDSDVYTTIYTIDFSDDKDARDAFAAANPEDQAEIDEVLMEMIGPEDVEGINAKVGQQIITNNSGQVTFKVYLHHGQTMMLRGLPKGANYTIVETSSPGYKTTAINDSGIVESEDINVSFTNEKSGVVPTGIVVNIITPVMIASLAGLYFLLKARKTKELN